MSTTPTRPIRVAYLCLQATTEGQASHAHVHEIIAGLRSMGYEVDLHEPRYAGTTPPGAFGRALEFARIQRSLVRRLRHYDVLYVRAHPLALPLAWAARRAGIPTIQECNGPYEDFPQAWPSTRPFAGVLAAMARAQYRRAHTVIAVTPQLAEWITADTGQRSVAVIANGANVDLFTPDQPRPEGLPEHYAVFFGALQPWQGVRTILEAAEDAAWPEDLPLVVFGDGLLADEVRAAAARRPDRVRYLGRLPYREVPAVVANSSVSLAGFSTEHRTASGVSPVKLYESMACGVPVVAGNLPGQADVVRDEECGLLVEPVAPRPLAEAVARVVSDPETARLMGERGRAAAVRSHSWAAAARQTGPVIDAARASRTLAPPAQARVHRRIAYLSLQAVVEGQDTWAAVTEIVDGIKAEGWTVDAYYPDYGSRTKPNALKRLVEMTRAQARLARTIRDYDAVYVRAHPVAWPISMLARRRHVPVVQECNGPYEDLFIAWPTTRFLRPFFEYMQRSQYQGASAVIAVAQGLTDWLTADTGNPRVVTNPNGANVEVFTPGAGPHPGLPARYSVFFGQFPAWQGIRTLLEAARRPEWPRELSLVFVGDGVDRPAIEAAAADAPDRVVYAGRLPYGEVASVVAHGLASYVPLLASHGGFIHSPLKLYESMACGVPVIASDTPGISEVVRRHECGILVAPGDAAGLAEATRRLCEDPELAREMGRRGREAVSAHYSWRVRAHQRLEIVESAIEWSATPAAEVAIAS